MSQQDGQRHQFRGFIRGVSEHNPLVSGTLVPTVGIADRLRYFQRLRTHTQYDVCRFRTERLVVVGVSNFANGLTHNCLVVEPCPGRDFASEDYQRTLAERFTGYVAEFVLSEIGIKNAIRDIVAYLVRVSLRDRFRGKDVSRFG